MKIPIRDLNVQWLRQNIALVQQEPILFAATIEENLRMGKEETTTEEMVAACRMANAHEFICKLADVNTQSELNIQIEPIFRDIRQGSAKEVSNCRAAKNKGKLAKFHNYE